VGIDVRLETERAEPLAEVLDGGDCLRWLLSLSDADSMVCLPFIDPYGDTIFNRLQLPILLSEFESLSGHLTESVLEISKQQYLSGAESWPEAARHQAREYCERVTIGGLRDHSGKVVSLLRNALESGPHLYVRFVGD
jgi:hypothetical protein